MWAPAAYRNRGFAPAIRRPLGRTSRSRQKDRQRVWSVFYSSFLSLNCGTLVPTFRSSCSIAAPTSTNFGKSWVLANLLILVPLSYLKFLDRIRRWWRRNFKQAALVARRVRRNRRRRIGRD